MGISIANYNKPFTVGKRIQGIRVYQNSKDAQKQEDAA
jgi:hypothetical protein